MSHLSTNTANWFVYIIKSSDDSLYTGITTDIQRRWSEHNSSAKGAKYFRGRRPQAIVFISSQVDRSAATKMEMRIKKSKRVDKLALINSTQNEIFLHKITLPSSFFES